MSMYGNRNSIRSKINTRLLVLFALMLLVSAFYLSYSQSQLVEQMVEEKAAVLAQSYFDNINTLMLTGGMANRDLARNKLLLQEGVVDARILRAPGVVKTYGPGADYTAAVDELDRRALQGEAITHYGEGERGRLMTLIVPMPAGEDVHGVNCLSCHPVAAGELLGAVRVDMSLAEMDAQVQRSILISIGITALLMILALLVVRALVQRMVTDPVCLLSDKMRDVAEGSADYRQRIPVGSRDELGDLADHFNAALAKFGGIIEQTQEQSERAMRIQTALDCVDTNVMVADRDDRIIYLNQAMQATLKHAEKDLAALIPGFQADQVIGSDIDRFHRQPEQKRQLLDRLTGSHEGRIEVGDLTFRICINPVINRAGERLGVAMEWADLTAELRLKQDEARRLESEREQANENARIRSALDNVSSCVMMADNERRIIYMNKTVRELFLRAESDIRKDLPDFDASRLLGASIDVFHREPAHQAAMLEQLVQPYSAETMVGGRTLRIVASPVFSDQGERLGTAVEWTDRTAEVTTENEVESLIVAARAGNLSTRLADENKSGFFRQLTTSLNDLLGIVEAVFDELGAVMAAMAEGDLTRPIRPYYRGTFGQVRDNVNNTLINLEFIVREICTAAHQIQGGSAEISAGNNNLSHRTEQQAASLEETASSMAQLTTTVRHNAENAQQANRVSSSARELAERGGTVVNHAIAAMEEINQASGRIAEIIGVIDEIAFQTNLLALNASVEAARAGEQGRGFAVVATEVRSLASRSAMAAKEIKELIHDSVDKVQAGSELVNRSGATLSEIVASVKEVGEIIAEIATVSSEQAAGIEQINIAVSSMDGTTQQNAALAEQTSAAAHVMTEHAEAMMSRIDFFKVREDADADWDIEAEHSAPFTFADARSAHLAWRGRLRDFLDGRGVLSEREAVSHRDCRLGQWLYAEGAAEQYARLKEMGIMEAEHEAIHRLIRDIVRLKQDGQDPEAERLYEQIEPLSQKIVHGLRQIESQVEKA